jgi:16S rRNA (guanine(966)-N(2))-methyltransferase RsmD
VRIVGGEHKGRIIEVSRDFDSRPTTDFAREALFNILTNQVDFTEIAFLDLFGGTGSISMECHSRGCRNIDLVEINSKAIHFIGQVARKLNMSEIHTVRMDVFPFLEICRKQYNVIFADPPFELKGLATIPGIILQKNILAPEGVFILEHPASYHFDKEAGFVNERKYGSVHFSFFRK